MKNLISMTDFVLEQDEKRVGMRDYCNLIVNYANFLKKPLELWMFIPCDKDGNVLEEPDEFSSYYDDIKYQETKERCLFQDHDLDLETINHHIKLGRTVEYFASFETLQLTKTTLKQIGL